jgi:hypothetical protein
MFGVDDTWAWLESVATRVLNELFEMSESSKYYGNLNPRYLNISDKLTCGRNSISNHWGG